MSVLTPTRTRGLVRPALVVEGVFVAAVLDVDRVEFDGASAASIADANVNRLLRSLLGERLGLGSELDPGQIDALRATAVRGA